MACADSDYASFNLFVARDGSTYQNELSNSLSKGQLNYKDSSKNISSISSVSPNKILKLYKYAIFSFYFRPKMIIKYILKIKTYHQFKLLIINSIGMFKNVLKVKW